MAARMRTCSLCGGQVKVNIAAHPCPHDNACRYLCNDRGMPVDWETPECRSCQAARKQVALPLSRRD